MGRFVPKSATERERAFNVMSETDVIDMEMCQASSCKFNKYSQTSLRASLGAVALCYRPQASTRAVPSKRGDVFGLEEGLGTRPCITVQLALCWDSAGLKKQRLSLFLFLRRVFHGGGRSGACPNSSHGGRGTVDISWFRCLA